MPRTIHSEILDSLPPQDPEAVHNRRDLRLTNQLMGNYRWIEGAVAAHAKPSDRILEIGAGEGDLSRRLALQGFHVDGLDLWPKPAGWPAARLWHQGDLRQFSDFDGYRVIVGNLIFHQFTDDELAAVGARLHRAARLIIACEPVRRRFSQTGFALLGRLFGANRVSLHDAHVSISAGFVGDELPRLLGLDPAAWDLDHSTTIRGAYHLIARRRQP